MLVNNLTEARILIVDDQEANILLLQSLLDEAGYIQIRTTTDSRSVLSIFGDFQPDLILLDLHMPYLDGYTLLGQLRNLIPPQTYLPILVLTADATQQARQRSLEIGAKDFLTKPFDPLEVLLRVRNLLETRALHIFQQNQNQILEERVKERTAKLHLQTVRAEALARTAAHINTQLDRQAVLNAVCQETAQAMNVPIVMVALFDETQRAFVNAAVVGMPEESQNGFAPWPLSYIESLPQQSKNVIVLKDVQARSTTGPNRQLYERLNIRTAFAALIFHQNDLLGGLNIFSVGETRHFSDDEIVLLRALADQTAQAIVNARLYQNLQKYSAQLEERVAERTAALQVANSRLQQANAEVVRALEQEKELSELKSRFLSVASHEFRTPLAVILSSAQLLQRYASRLSEQKKADYLHRIQTSVQRMTSLVDDVLLVEQGRIGRLQFNPKSLDMIAFCQGITEEFQLGIGRQHQIVLSLAELENAASLPARLDENLLDHILRNLLSNAIKYSPPDSRVTLNLARTETHVRLTVTDQGIGIPARDQARLFESFHRASNVGVIQGTGLGLHIVKQAVERHGGTIAVQSQEEQGSTFTVELPLNAE